MRRYVMKKGFVSIATMYTFLIVFLLVIASIMAKYINRNKLINNIQTNTKAELNLRYDNE
jgi:hypothetical protein